MKYINLRIRLVVSHWQKNIFCYVVYIIYLLYCFIFLCSTWFETQLKKLKKYCILCNSVALFNSAASLITTPDSFAFKIYSLLSNSLTLRVGLIFAGRI